LLLNELHFIDVNIWAFWPLILVLVGGLLVWRAMGKRRHAGHGDPDAVASESVVNTFTMFGGVGRRNASQDFKGGEITTILGGCELDLRGASIKNGPAVIDVFVFWGGIDIKVPEDWTVSIETMPLMGGCDDKTRPAKNGSGKHLVIKGYIIMGGLEIG
jgi:predicted membrane protein